MRAPPEPPPRYLPARALPARAYVPGRSPGPRPAAAPDEDAAAPGSPRPGDGAAAGWERHPAFLWGLDLYNHGYPWEAHEAWESLWLRAPRGSPERDMLQVLIQCAAAAVHARAGRRAGQARLAARALGRLAEVRARAGRCCLGIDIDALASAMRAYAHADDAEGWPRVALVAGA